MLKLKDFFSKVKKADIEEVKDSIKPYGFEEGRDFDELDSFSGKINKVALNQLGNDPNVKSVELNHVFSISLQDSVGLINASILHNTVVINNITGKNVAVCVLDTGINYNHVVLSGNYLDGYDYVNDDADPIDDHGHGTHVTGIVQGVAPDVGLIHIKVLNSGGSGTQDDIIAGINWCINNRTAYNISVISMSLGAGEYDSYCDSSFPSLALAVNDAISNGLVVVASSGNLDGIYTDINKISSPGCIENTIAVGATDKSDNLASYGKRNSLVDILAIGSNINSPAIGGGYVTMSGTSMSAPHVSGAVALAQQFEFEEDGNFSLPSVIESAFKTSGVAVDSYFRIDVDDGVVELDNTNPSLTVYSPESVNYTERLNLSLNYSAEDAFLDEVFYNLNDGMNVSLNGNSSLYLEGGTYILNVYANDRKNNTNSFSLVFGIDIPKVTLNSPADNTNDLDGYIEFNCSVSDISSLSNISLYHNLSGSWEINQTQSVSGTEASVVFPLNLTGDLVFDWNCWAFDADSNDDMDENRTMRINVNSAPVINDFFPNFVNVNVSEPANQTFNVSYSDSDSDVLNVSWYKDGVVVDTDAVYDFLGDYSSSGEYNITVTVSDDALSASNFWNFTVFDVEVCGDGVKNSTEGCDGSDFGGSTCDDYGYDSGSLSCNDCVISSSGCSNTTSDGSTGSGGSSGGETSTSNEVNSILEDESFASSGSSDSKTVDLLEEGAGEATLDTATENQGEGTTEEVVQPEKAEKNLNSIIGAAVGGLFLVVVSLWFIRKEWRVIKRKAR